MSNIFTKSNNILSSRLSSEEKKELESEQQIILDNIEVLKQAVYSRDQVLNNILTYLKNNKDVSIPLLIIDIQKFISITQK